MENRFFKSLMAVAMLLGSTLGFVACEDAGDEIVANPTVEVSAKTLHFTVEEGSQILNITANSLWNVENDIDWVTITPMEGEGDGKIVVAVSMNDTGALREATFKVNSIHKEHGKWYTRKVKVSQSANEAPTVEEDVLYSDNFDGREATKEYGNSNSSWPYIDQFPDFANPTGPAGANVTYSGSGVSVRANSTSNSSYSDYAGSGSNNIFFGGGAYFQINNVAPLEGVNFKVTFGTEKFSQDGDSTFRPEEFILYISKNGTEWAPVEYTFAGTEPGRWNVATANFTLAASTETLHIKFEAKVASVYRLDDVKFYTGNGGQIIDLDNIQIETPEPPTTDALYYDNFDGQGAAQDSSNYWPYVNDFPQMKNAAGAAATNVSYEGYNATVRNNSNSDGSYSDYAGSGVNNIFFGKGNAWFMIKELALESSQNNLALTFGTEKYSQTLGSKFTPSEFLVQLSADGSTWSNVEYTFAGTAEGRWNVATANFTLKTVPEKLYIKFTALAESAYRLDDVTLDLGNGGQEIDLANGTTEQPGGGEPVNPDQPNVPANGTYASDSAFVCSSDDSTNAVYSLKDTKIAGNPVTGFKLGKSKLQGKFTSGVVSVTGTKYLNFYAGAWNGTTATLYVRVDDGVAQSVNLAGNVGAHDNAPYTNPELSFADSDHFSLLFEGLTESSKVEFSTNADFALTTHSGQAPDIAPRVIVCGVKLTDEPLGAETPGGGEPVNPDPDPEPDPEPTPGEVVVATVAEFLDAAEDETIYELTGVIKNVANTNYGNFDLKDATGTVYVYGINDKDGNKVFTSLGLKEGDTLTIRGKRTSYNDAPQMGSGVYVSHISAPEQEQPENEATLSFADANNRVSWDTSKQVWTANGITLTNNKGASTSNVADYVAPARFYKSSELIVECDHAISKIDFACNTGAYATALKDSITSGNVTVDGSIVTVTFSTPVSSYTINSLTGGQVRMNSLTVTYAE